MFLSTAQKFKQIPCFQRFTKISILPILAGLFTKPSQFGYFRK